jgi:hypothetical protein
MNGSKKLALAIVMGLAACAFSPFWCSKPYQDAAHALGI